MSGEREDAGSSRLQPTPVAPSRGGEGERQPVTVEMAAVFVAAGRRFLTQRAAERHAAKRAIRDFARATGDDFDADQYAELVAWLVPQVRRGQSVDAGTVERFLNPANPGDVT